MSDEKSSKAKQYQYIFGRDLLHAHIVRDVLTVTVRTACGHMLRTNIHSRKVTELQDKPPEMEVVCSLCRAAVKPPQ